MSDSTISSTGPRVMAYALIGQQNKLLLVADDRGRHSLPGGAVNDGEPVESALRRTLHDQLDATITHLDFCSVVEYHAAKLGRHSASEVAVLFDVALTGLDHLDPRRPNMPWWADEPDLASLRPEAIRDGLLAGTLSSDYPWWAWTP
ncbi:NUDIX domain-containing protein [Amycolatopsis sp. H20-H5]|uniref:NUDIX domain-containing protein n=1 Tax=Amycolatopsis sp. H20-H5 TaxID=3046309 RepID=UPI002DBE04AE|nr:NUDIX domain-containing protein [Amycolatopsis sp. H20-H5]MEC3978901.1 NUDIX domain-containing protein [Amycolatopsis sp. H20-H5]